SLRGESMRAIETLRVAASAGGGGVQSAAKRAELQLALAAAHLDVGEFQRAEAIIAGAVDLSGIGDASEAERLWLRRELVRLRILRWRDKPQEELRERAALRERLEATCGPDAEPTSENEIRIGFVRGDRRQAMAAERS